MTTNYTCGEVADKNAQTSYNGVVGSYLRVHNVSNQVMTNSGDSGGPVFGTKTAYGIVHGRGGAGTPTRNDLYFMPVERFEVLDISVVTEPFRLDNIPSVSGPHNVNIPAEVNFKGYLRFPLKRQTQIVSCATGWNCSDYNQTYTTNVPSPLTFNYRCNVSGYTPTATFRWRTTLVGADGVTTNAIEHTSTCTESGTGPGATRVSLGREAAAPTISIVP